MKRTCEEVRKAVEGVYYSSIDKKMHWEPFENYPPEWVKDQVESDTRYWCEFFGVKYEERGGAK